MEILRVITLALLFLVIPALSNGQDFDVKREAFRKSIELELSGNYSSAVSVIKTVYDEKSYEANLRLGWLQYLAGEFTESIRYYQKAIVLMPYSVEPRFGITYPLNSMGDVNKLVEQYNKILEITPNNSVAIYWLGVVQYNKGDYEQAKKSFEKVINLYPFDYDGLNMLAWTHFKLGSTREAKVLFQKALLNNPAGQSAIEGYGLLK